MYEIAERRMEAARENDQRCEMGVDLAALDPCKVVRVQSCGVRQLLL